MRRLCDLLGLPQNRFASIHVVGTNGKTSVATMTAALLEAHGVASGAYLSPHVVSWRERIRLRGEPVPKAAFASAVERSAEAAAIAERAFDEGEWVTQFELATAAAFMAFAQARVRAAVIEAGLGGRLDATNVIRAKVVALTSVGLDHTEYLGETLAEIAAEKAAVLDDHATLVVGELPPEANEVAERFAGERHAKLIRAPAEPPAELAGLVSGYQRHNLAIALAATEAFLGRLDLDAARSAADHLQVHGRAELVEGEPPLLFDTAHNPDGARALAESLPELGGGRPVVACVAVLAEKDAAGICAALAPACEIAVCTEFPAAAVKGSGRPGGEAMPAASLADVWRAAGGEAEQVLDPVDAWARARELAAERGGVALAAGSHYLLRTLWIERHAESS
jgi:dihydrofolate synthase/folylpolyglutamate synthase